MYFPTRRVPCSPLGLDWQIQTDELSNYYLSNGTELGPTTPQDLVPGEKIPVVLQATDTPFTWWVAHPEVGGSGGESGGGETGDEGGGEGGNAGESGGEHGGGAHN